MSLEQLTKNELVRDLRAANQSNKSLQSEVEQLKKQVAELSEQSDNVGNTDQAELPYLAVSQFRELEGPGGFIVKLRFDLAGNAKIISKEYKNENYKVNWEAVKFLEVEIEKQIEVSSSTVKEVASNEAKSGSTDEY